MCRNQCGCGCGCGSCGGGCGCSYHHGYDDCGCHGRSGFWSIAGATLGVVLVIAVLNPDERSQNPRTRAERNRTAAAIVMTDVPTTTLEVGSHQPPLLGFGSA